MEEYHDLYLKTDILLIGDALEESEIPAIIYYGLDPCHCFMSPRSS